MQYTADEQDSCSSVALEVQLWRGNGSEKSWRHVVSHFTCCTATGCLNFTTGIPDEFSDVWRLIRPTIYEQDLQLQ